MQNTSTLKIPFRVFGKNRRGKKLYMYKNIKYINKNLYMYNLYMYKYLEW